MIQKSFSDSSENVLIVEDSKTFGRIMKRRLENDLHVSVTWKESKADYLAALNQDDARFDAAVLDVNLPDAPNGEIIDLVLSRGVPSIILTGSYDPNLRERLWEKRIADYIPKDSVQCIDNAVNMTRRILRNANNACLVVDSSQKTLQYVETLLYAQGYKVLTAVNGKEALAAINDHQDIKLLLVDYTIPEMDGAMLTQEVRKIYSPDRMAIVGMSNADVPSTSIRFLKSGSNDYIKKPFQIEEFYCRISLNVDMVLQFETIRTLAYTDFLTGVCNRRRLFELAEAALAEAGRQRLPVAVAMLDIDRFKRINDTHGHDVGDMTLRHLAGLLKSHFATLDGSRHVGRIGGEEFCVVATGAAAQTMPEACEALRHAVEESRLETTDAKICFTVSIGLVEEDLGRFEDLLKVADEKLYAAKTGGRNRLVR